MRSHLAAFTLTELLVAMAIIAVTTGLGFQALGIFRQTMQFQQAQNDFLSQLRDVQNRARNSVVSQKLIAQGQSPTGARVDGFAIYFGSSNYTIRYCYYQPTGANKNRYNCSGVEASNVKADEFADIEILPTNLSKCLGIFWGRLEGEIAAMASDTATLDNSGVCQIQLKHKFNTGLNGQITIDLSNNNLDAN